MTSLTSTRPDGRLPAELRPIRIEPGYLKYAEGSALVSVGDTRVLCAASLEERGMGIAAIVLVVSGLGIALSAKSLAALGRAAPWTSAGWCLTLLYFIETGVKATLAPGLPAVAEYGALAALTLAFGVAGVRDEPQAEPWWWPSRRSATRAEKRRAV